MTERVEVHVKTTDGGWELLGTVFPGKPGSLSHITPDGGTEVYVFGWVDGHGPYVLRSIGGVHLDGVENREILTHGFDVVADLRAAPTTLPITGRTRTAPVRFTHRPVD